MADFFQLTQQKLKTQQICIALHSCAILETREIEELEAILMTPESTEPCIKRLREFNRILISVGDGWS